MTSPAEEIIVECPACKRWYDSWHRPSINRLIDNFSDEFIEKASTAICPYCNCKAALGIWLTNSLEQITIIVPQARFKPKSDHPIYSLTIDCIDPARRLRIMKAIRSVAYLGIVSGITEVKDLLTRLPQILIEDKDQKKLENLKTMLEAAGAKVTIDYSSNQ